MRLPRTTLAISLSLSFLLATFGYTQTTQTPAAPASAPAAEAAETPETLWKSLLLGNEKYRSGTETFDKLNGLRGDLLRDGQHPPITILACSDSRLPPELVFKQTLGQIFIIRVAGNVADTFALASIEYAIARGYTKLLVVLGHQDCGAVKAALERGAQGTPSLDALADRIRESFGPKGCWNPSEACMAASAKANALASAAWLMAHSITIRNAVLGNPTGFKLVSAYYDMRSGEVELVK